ncbi:Hypothetical protein FKW44_020893, partial [Caligus rogercresseyi]
VLVRYRQLHLNTMKIWSGCPNYNGEVILSRVFEDLKVDSSKSHDVMGFGRWQKN